MSAAWITGEAAAELTGKTVAEIDAAAAAGEIAAQYQGWRLMVSLPETKKPRAARRVKK
ncbi:MAG: hypothetical protein K2X97_01825 [Mycobacteriaceae bacterium]|nr:hypothetical protein [Mycobacteriaceae bacterium]